MSVCFRTFAACLPAACFVLLCGCSSGPEPERERVIAEAYAGPATLKLHQEVDPRSPVSATVSHGEKLQIVRRRRRFVKVRTTAGGKEGWTDIRQLLAASEMEELNQLAETARALPTQGAATVYEALNVHTESNRLSPSFYHLKVGELVEVVGHELAPRVAYEARDVIPASPPKPARARKPAEASRVPRPSPPPPPKLPDNWLDLSKTELPAEEPAPVVEPPKPVPVDDWSLVRLKNGRAGWVLTGMLRMEIPDEVAQYSEGARITSYFAMADVNDGGQVRHHWLWTTLSKVRSPYEFDSFRYFIWNTRRHRYETAYIEKNLKGYFPVRVHKVKALVGKKEEEFPGFSLLLEDESGARWKKTYAFEYYRVVLVDKQPYEAPAKPENPKVLATESPASQPARPSLSARLKALGKKLLGR